MGTDEIAMNVSPSTFSDVWAKGKCVPIPNCPGRYKLVLAENNLSLAGLIGTGSAISEYHVPAARDAVLIAKLVDGGMISYRRLDGTYLHTLNTVSGFIRKLTQLGLAKPD